MVTPPDFRRASFIVSLENPFRLTPPRAQAFRSSSDHAISDLHAQGTSGQVAGVANKTQHSKKQNTASKKESSNEQHYPDPTFASIVDGFHQALTQRKAQVFALLALTNSELMLIKKSFFVTVFAGLAAFAVGTVCWLILNIAAGSVLHVLGLHYVAISFLLLLFNGVTTFLLFRLAQNAFGYLGLGRLILMWKRTM
ncbi:hypothetical protein D210916BOD24_11880 [Alteromonas sp. D210916BOD_24]|uniref:hypothetical protein n=1 Tax=Alteromonas sp. D210916BOD_24 TaxID=3157618 RepID=UPI00399C6A7A